MTLNTKKYQNELTEEKRISTLKLLINIKTLLHILIT